MYVLGQFVLVSGPFWGGGQTFISSSDEMYVMCACAWVDGWMLVAAPRQRWDGDRFASLPNTNLRFFSPDDFQTVSVVCADCLPA
jgi:hypothetical protein